MNLVSLPTILVMVLYISLCCLIAAVVTVISMICKNYIKSGEYLDFGVSRGLGSLSYATTVAVLGPLIEMFDASVIGWMHLISSIALLLLLNTMPDSDIVEEDNEDKTDSSVFGLFKNKVFVLILFAIAFEFAASTSLSTYLVNIVTDLGGTTSLYGVAVFAMAASELPFMAITHTLLKKLKFRTLKMASLI